MYCEIYRSKFDALEREQIKSGSGVPGFLPFIPPYSAAPANLEIRSELSKLEKKLGNKGGLW